MGIQDTVKRSFRRSIYVSCWWKEEEKKHVIQVRSRFKGDEGQMKLDDFLAAIKEEIANRENRKVEKED